MISKLIAWGMLAHVAIAGVGLIVAVVVEAPWYICIWQGMVFLASLWILIDMIYQLRKADRVNNSVNRS